jgi:hypothetical protein
MILAGETGVHGQKSYPLPHIVHHEATRNAQESITGLCRHEAGDYVIWCKFTGVFDEPEVFTAFKKFSSQGMAI